MERSVKQVVVMRRDLNMRKGKMVAQGAHASLGAFLKLFKKMVGYMQGLTLVEQKQEGSVVINQTCKIYHLRQKILD